MLKIINITKSIKTEPDHDFSPDYLGYFSDSQETEYTINHDQGDRNAYRYFNAENVTSQDEAQENYDEYMEYEKGIRSFVHVFAQATFTFQQESPYFYTLMQSIDTAGVWGVGSDDVDGIKEIGESETETLNDMIEAFKNCTL